VNVAVPIVVAAAAGVASVDRGRVVGRDAVEVALTMPIPVHPRELIHDLGCFSRVHVGVNLG
jgi:hypothetical protein